MSQPAHYFVTDIESDGPDPARNSMLSFATVVVREDGEMCGEFEAVMTPRADRSPDEQTMKWWAGQPDAWQAATSNPVDPADAMKRFADWVETYPPIRSFAARPVAFDGAWIDRYLRDFAGSYLLDIPYWGRNIFTAGALDIGAYMCGVLGQTKMQTLDTVLPAEWLGHHPHTHRAIDDARGYASLLATLLRRVHGAGKREGGR
ncbi:DNA polymerase III epsilon subunit-like protein [Hoeflea marina]|uniref:DNA polymerase III epsilon subunit-like protein n=1 Tax=Hoeflea marina TaxID=274592 RepID=A0A317PKL5_9HYPH|nr:3'-5' exoribonuclease [Hoeflea marina]PWW00205.1 DNA polymerase III epsilon subunit-like protein [Hoeflea marina]